MNIYKCLVFGVGMCISTSTAHATTSAKAVFDGLYPGNSTACEVCHFGTVKPVSLRAYGFSYTGKGGSKDGTQASLQAIESLDADGDTINNVLEIRTGTDPSVVTALGTAVVGTDVANGDVLIDGPSVGGVSLTKVQNVTTEFGVTLATGQDVLGGVKVGFSLASIGPVTLTYTAAGASGTVKVHELVGTGSSTALTATTSSSGSVIFTPTSLTPTVVVEYTASAVPAPVLTGCMTPVSMLPMSLFMLFSLGLWKRKND